MHTILLQWRGQQRSRSSSSLGRRLGVYLYSLVSSPDNSRSDPTSPYPIRFRTAEEFRNRDAYRYDLDPDAHKLQEIIGDYKLNKAEQLQCGLKGCHSWHWHGYVVRTADGLETNIGRDCGKTHFKVNWGEVHSAFDRAAEARDTQEWLENMVRQRDALQARANAFFVVIFNRTEEVRQIVARISKEPALYQALQVAVRTGGVIQAEREISAEDAKARGIPESQRRYLENVGRIFGIEALQPGYKKGSLKGDDILAKLKSQVMATLSRLSSGSLKALNRRQQKERVKELETVNALLAEAERHVDITRRFLTPANVREIGKLQVHKPNERTKRILQQFATLQGNAPPSARVAICGAQ
jgi:hypothetical protein